MKEICEFIRLFLWKSCQLRVAASTTIASSPEKKGQIVLVPGNQTGFVKKEK